MIILKCKKELGRMKGDYESIEEDMKKILAELLIYEILSVVEEIPEGKVASYGQIAALIGREKNARLVGKVLSEAGGLRRLSVSQSGKPCMKDSSGLAYAESFWKKKVLFSWKMDT